jgi:hypothetical protein
VLNLKIIIGSTREGRAADRVVPWLTRRAQTPRHSSEIVDLREWARPFSLPHALITHAQLQRAS